MAIVVDDLQWADLPSARALLFALRRLRQDNIVVLLASRPHSVARLGDSWSRLLAERARRIRLHGLTPPDLQPLARTLVGVDLALAARERLCEHTGGNPLYVRALLEELPAIALADQSRALPAPHSYAAIVLTQVARVAAFRPGSSGRGECHRRPFLLVRCGSRRRDRRPRGRLR